MPDPTVIRDGDTFYLYATEAVRNVPIMKSRDLVNWTLCGTVFSEATRPDFTEGGEIWAPDINYGRRPLSALLFALLVGRHRGLRHRRRRGRDARRTLA